MQKNPRTLDHTRGILIVEDDKLLRDLLTEKLERSGFKVVGAIDGKQALEKLNDVAPALIILDLVLPGLDGFEILHHLKENPATKTIPVLVLSNLGDKSDVRRAKDLGAKEYLIKAHYTLDDITRRVEEMVS